MATAADGTRPQRAAIDSGRAPRRHAPGLLILQSAKSAGRGARRGEPGGLGRRRALRRVPLEAEHDRRDDTGMPSRVAEASANSPRRRGARRTVSARQSDAAADQRRRATGKNRRDGAFQGDDGAEVRPVPVVAARPGRDRGGCEICLHADRIQASAETYIGRRGRLVDSGRRRHQGNAHAGRRALRTATPPPFSDRCPEDWAGLDERADARGLGFLRDTTASP